MSFNSHEEMAVIILKEFVVYMVISGCTESCDKVIKRRDEQNKITSRFQDQKEVKSIMMS
jgi:hypothetical protein